jgi:sulfite reductase (NADPH) flavoprotein alpha-component
MVTIMTIYNKQNPFLATIIDRFPLSKCGSKKYTHHIALDISHSGITYEVGDSIAVFATHDPELVQRTLQAMRATGEESIVDKHSGQTLPLKEFLSTKANISELSRKLISELAIRQIDPKKRERLQFLLEEGNKDALKEYQAGHELWDALAENEEVTFALQELCDFLMPLLPRFYSIASSMVAVGDRIDLTVAHFQYLSNGFIRHGVCTHYLCHIAPQGVPAVPIYLHPHRGFTLPEDLHANLIMIGPGTGIAPFRGFMQERMAKKAPGKNWLFFGEWTKAYDYFYEDYWVSLQRESKLQLDLAFSRDQEHKIYVQHRMLEHAEELFRWIEEGAFIFVCGDAHRMAKDVDATLHRIIQEQGKMDEHGTKEYVKRLRNEKRYLRDVY